ncbi:MAG: AbrB/MazE/SpoVT family DNA-binding domain-containing protein [Treponema sp.]|jgi:antitoxin MazE|nr:AbrB/MazE/SpoVT family DNA-binding domain-containing protein [Treponema sp.]
MEAMVKKWGNSLGIRIPNFFVQNMSLKDGACVEMTSTNAGILIAPKASTSLSEMLSKITEENVHAEIETGPAVGAEVR